MASRESRRLIFAGEVPKRYHLIKGLQQALSNRPALRVGLYWVGIEKAVNLPYVARITPLFAKKPKRENHIAHTNVHS